MVQLPTDKNHTNIEHSGNRPGAGSEDRILAWRKAIDKLCASYRQANEKYDSRLLIVDPDRSASILLADFLHDLDYRVDVAHDGQSALGHVRRKTYHLVVMEMNLPDMDGIELYDHIKQERTSRRLQAVILTADTDPNVIRISQSRGIRGVLSKPVNLVELLRYIQQLREPVPLVN